MSDANGSARRTKYVVLIALFIGGGAAARYAFFPPVTNDDIAAVAEPSAGAVQLSPPVQTETQPVELAAIRPDAQSVPEAASAQPAAAPAPAAEPDIPSGTGAQDDATDSAHSATNDVQPLSEPMPNPTVPLQAKTDAPALDVAGSDAPRLDELRLDLGGLAVIAGRAAAFSEVVLRVDGTEVARTAADGRGAFATVAILPPSATARVLTLTQISDGGAEVPSPDTLILAPAPQPAQLADAPQTASTIAAAPERAGLPSLDATPAVPQPLDAPQITAALDTVGAAPDVVASARLATPNQDDTAAQVYAQSAADLPAVTAPAAQDDRAQASLDALRSDGAASATDTPEQTTVALLGGALQTPAVPGAEPVLPQPDQTAIAAPQPALAPAQPRPVAVLRAGPGGLDVLQPLTPTPEVMSQVALDTISYSAAGDVQLSGRAQLEAREVRVYLDNRPIASLAVGAQGDWRGDLPDVDTGIYTLRIDEVAADGSVTSRVETPFKREEPEALAAAQEQGTGAVRAITVQAGATLWAIARERYGDGLLYVQVFEANRAAIRNPDLIYPGQVFTLPE